jgi:uncharacterized membrane protein YphA (DoxX/SURF4 family)
MYMSVPITTATATVLATGFTTLGAAKITKRPTMQTRAEHVGFNAKSYQLIGAAEVAGAAGVLVGLAYRPVGYAAATGLLGLLGGAGLAHARHGGDLPDLLPAGAFAVGTLAYLIALRQGR